MHLSLAQPNSRSAFSLMELLVVIGIIAILAAIAFPVLGNMSKKGKATESVNNMRQWGTAFLLFSADNNMQVPYEGTADSMNWSLVANAANARSWFNVLPPYVQMKPMRDLQTAAEREQFTQNAGIFRCPLVNFRRSTVPNFAYMMNSQLYSPPDDGAPTNSADKPLLLIQVARPAITVLLADGGQNVDPNQFEFTRPRGRGTHTHNRQPGKQVNLLMMDGSARTLDSAFVRSGTTQDNNHPDLIWNPWRHETAL